MKLLTRLSVPVLFVLLILDARACTRFAGTGIQLCIQTVIPSLFPLLFLSIAMNSTLAGLRIPGFRFLGRVCRIPPGSEGILLLGVTGGYPAGAKAIADAQREGTLSVQAARRMLGFCNNAGPAFIFGTAGSLFENRTALWLLWLIQIFSALFTAVIFPGGSKETCRRDSPAILSFSDALRRTLHAMAGICGWVILFQVFTGMCRRWFLWMLPTEISAIFMGAAELTGGITALSALESEAQRFLYASVFLSFGGLCIAMQTKSAAGALGIRSYLLGKSIQTPISLLLASLFGSLLYGTLPVRACLSAAAALFGPAAFLLALHQKRYGNSPACSV